MEEIGIESAFSAHEHKFSYILPLLVSYGVSPVNLRNRLSYKYTVIHHIVNVTSTP